MQKTTKSALKVGVGVATAAAVAAAAAAYLLSGEEGKQRREKAQAWLSDAKREIAANIKTARRLGETEYDNIVDRVLEKYGSMEDVSVRDIIQAGRELKAAWDKIRRNASSSTTTASGGARRSGSRTTTNGTKTRRRRTRRTSGNSGASAAA